MLIETTITDNGSTRRCNVPLTGELIGQERVPFQDTNLDCIQMTLKKENMKKQSQISFFNAIITPKYERDITKFLSAV